MNLGVIRAARGLATLGLVAGLGLAAAPTHADPVPTPAPADVPGRIDAGTAKAGDVSVYGTTRTTSTKRKKVEALVSAGGGTLSVSLGLAGERHSWQFEMAAKDLKVDGKGAGTLRTKAAGPYGAIALKIVPRKSWKVEKCKGVVLARTRPVTLKGTFRFDSSGAWGAVGKKQGFSLKGAVTRYTGKDGSSCYDRFCPATGGFAYFYQDNTSLSVSWRAKKTVFRVDRYADLARPKGAYRNDSREVSIPTPVLTRGDGGAARLKLSGGKKAKGTATLRSAAGDTTTETSKGKSYTTTWWNNATYANGSTPLTMRMSAFGDIKLGNGDGYGAFSRTTRD